MEVALATDQAAMPAEGVFSPLRIRGLELRNRLVVSPMCQYSAKDGLADDFHLVHLGKFAQGGFGLIFTEATAVREDGRITHGDIGLWCDDQIAPLKRITDFIRRCGACSGIQLAHAGRKACKQRPWEGNGPLTQADRDAGEFPWPVVGPSPIPVADGWLMPRELTIGEIEEMVGLWRNAARRAVAAGFDVAEIHGGHGYLLHQFLSPLTNQRTDAYGGDISGRMRLPLEIASAVREVWPAELPVFFRMSVTDHAPGGWDVQDSVVLARELARRGIDVMDCSSGGLGGLTEATRVPQAPGFQVPLSARVRQDAGVRTMAVGLILDGAQADAVIGAGGADLVAIGREALFNPNFALHGEAALGRSGAFESWPVQYGWWLDRRARLFEAARR